MIIIRIFCLGLGSVLCPGTFQFKNLTLQRFNLLNVISILRFVGLYAFIFREEKGLKTILGYPRSER